MRAYDVIYKKRNGQKLSEKEISFMIEGYTKHEIADYQMSAFLMSVYFQKVVNREYLFCYGDIWNFITQHSSDKGDFGCHQLSFILLSFRSRHMFNREGLLNNCFDGRMLNIVPHERRFGAS